MSASVIDIIFILGKFTGNESFRFEIVPLLHIILFHVECFVFLCHYVPKYACSAQ